MLFNGLPYTSTTLDIATILDPPPNDMTPGVDDVAGLAIVDAWIERVEAHATELAHSQDRGHEATDTDDWQSPDVLLDTLKELRRRRDDIERSMILLAAYMRENIKPRPYTLGQVAAAAGMSTSGIRTFYTTDDVHTLHAHLTRARRILNTAHNPESHETHTPPAQ